MKSQSLDIFFREVRYIYISVKSFKNSKTIDWHFLIIYPCGLKKRKIMVPIFTFESMEMLMKGKKEMDF